MSLAHHTQPVFVLIFALKIRPFSVKSKIRKQTRQSSSKMHFRIHLTKMKGRTEICHTNFTSTLFFIRNLFQSTRLYIKGILGGRPATLCLIFICLHSCLYLFCLCFRISNCLENPTGLTIKVYYVIIN